MSEILIAQPEPKVQDETTVNIKYFMPNGEIVEMEHLSMTEARRVCKDLRRQQLEQYDEQLIKVKHRRIK